jgi:hypothetical protein
MLVLVLVLVLVRVLVRAAPIFPPRPPVWVVHAALRRCWALVRGGGQW